MPPARSSRRWGGLLYGLRYHVAEMCASADGERVRYRSSRPGAAFAATYAPAGRAARAEPGSLEHFLVERYRLFSQRRGRLVTAEVAHEPWPLQPAVATIELNEMAPHGLAFEGEPLLHFCRSVDAVISAPSSAGTVAPDDADRRRLRVSPGPRARRFVRPARRVRVPADAA